MLRDSVAVAVVCTCPRAILLAMITMSLSNRGFPFVSHLSMGLLWGSAWLGPPELHYKQGATKENWSNLEKSPS